MNTHFTDGATWISNSNCSTLEMFLTVQCIVLPDHPLDYACLTLRDRGNSVLQCILTYIYIIKQSVCPYDHDAPCRQWMIMPLNGTMVIRDVWTFSNFM